MHTGQQAHPRTSGQLFREQHEASRIYHGRRRGDVLATAIPRALGRSKGSPPPAMGAAAARNACLLTHGPTAQGYPVPVLGPMSVSRQAR